MTETAPYWRRWLGAFRDLLAVMALLVVFLLLYIAPSIALNVADGVIGWQALIRVPNGPLQMGWTVLLAMVLVATQNA